MAEILIFALPVYGVRRGCGSYFARRGKKRAPPIVGGASLSRILFTRRAYPRPRSHRQSQGRRRSQRSPPAVRRWT